MTVATVFKTTALHSGDRTDIVKTHIFARQSVTWSFIFQHQAVCGAEDYESEQSLVSDGVVDDKK